MTTPSRTVTVVLAGRQNSGKTSLLMHLTHSAQHPVNFPGTSVERVESEVRLGDTVLRAVDLPGIGSMEALSRDEEVAIHFLQGDGGRPDVLCAVLDAAKLSVELNLLAQLSRLGLPIVVALNKNDVARAAGRPVDALGLAGLLQMPVVETNALSGAGVTELQQVLLSTAGQAPSPPLSAHPDEIAALVQPTLEGKVQTLTDRLDSVLLHPIAGLPIVALILLCIFQLLFFGAEPLIKLIEAGQNTLSAWVAGQIPEGALQSLLTKGLINGLGSIVTFVPQIVLLVLMVSILEGSGYMARAAFLLDRLLSRVGLSGKSFVPLVSSFACAVPGVLATRIIDNERDRLATIAVAPLMSCSARLPVYVLLIGAFFPPRYAALTLLGLYSLGIALAALVALLLRKTTLRGEQSVLMMELPVYQRPSPRVMATQVVTALREFFVLAGTVIFGAAILIWLLSYYPRPAALHRGFEARRAAVQSLDPEARRKALGELQNGEDAAYLEQSYLARAGKAIQPLFAPAGFDWRTTVGILSAFPARELIIPTLGILYSEGKVEADAYQLGRLSAPRERDGLRDKLRGARRADGKRVLSPLVAVALMVFFALCSQCTATLATIRRETRSLRWPVFVFSYMTVLAWVCAVLVFQVGSALGLGGT